MHTASHAAIAHHVTPDILGLKPATPYEAGFARIRCGRGHRFVTEAGTRPSEQQLNRVRALAIPPAWTDVWIAQHPDHHIQACGVDGQGRRQYIYHPDYRAAAEQAKFDQLALFAERLPRLRRRVKSALQGSAEDEAFVLATLVRLLDSAGLRIGSGRKTRTGAIGATGLERHHIELSKEGLALHFIAKGRKKRDVEIDDATLTRTVRRLMKHSERRLFAVHGAPVSARQVNAFISDSMGVPFTAKFFRTWGGTVAASKAVLSNPDTASIKLACDAASTFLGNTPAIARKSYIHPSVIVYARDPWGDVAEAGPTALKAAERRCLGLLASCPD
ncbi:hypothetical protein [Parvularcula sp. LCG005]|uniref:DNA topoisomerase IB n=1 Tax=Parvularcula sp. LCG005 TaxID=3078805 RepID=UPI002941D8D2|nr:hypothetical protein [Parvularcula sp. LCG005]WOI54058.1 hypothetical protein RUI03_03410 [Parvularcula sp. LCG005]